MADLYTNGALDYEKAARAIDGLKGVGNQGVRAAELQLIAAAAALDIAVSLGALIQGLANGGIWPDAPGVDYGNDEAPNAAVGADERARSLEVGDWVVSTLSHESAREVLAVSIREDEDCIDLGDGWVYASGYDLASADETLVDEPTPEPVDPDDLVDDIDSDFDEATFSAPRAGKKGKAKRGKQ